MVEANGSKSRFLFLCLKNRQPQYQAAMDEVGHDIHFVDNLDALLHQCIGSPPTGVLVDLATTMRIGISAMLPIHNLNMSWPIMRCNIASDSSVKVMHWSHNESSDLSSTLDSVSAESSLWTNPNSQRTYIRVDAISRIKIHSDKLETPSVGNITNMSTGGSLVVTYEPPPAGETVRLEFMDLADQTMECEAKTIWARRWEDGLKLPGVGFSFDEQNLDPLFKKAATDFLFNNFIRKNLKK